MRKLCWLALAAPLAATVLPTPQDVKPGAASAEFPKSQPITIVIGIASDRQAGIAADLLTRELKGFRVERAVVRPQSGSVIVLWNCATQGMPSNASTSDRKLLGVESHFGQSYLLETSAHEVRIAGSTGIGLLYGAATLIQLIQPTASGVEVPGAVIRDFPSFRYRAASDWLLRAELNRWAYDWGDGQRAYIERIRRKLDFCLRFKINMVMFDGFGWSVDRRPGYAAMMRDLNAYARERGIKLMFSGFGANFDPLKVEPEFHIGRVILNRRSYPDGPVYKCFGEGRRPDHPTYGTCRSNDALQREIAHDIEAFVRVVEPGALYIHHEDTGNYASTQVRWAQRCQDCMRRWPNPDFAAADGGAGAMAHGYGNILNSVNRVRNADSGYDAARDCTVVFISPPYGVDSNRSGMGSGNIDPGLNWSKTMEFWTNVLAAMPVAPNMEVGFREIFAGPDGRQWVDVYRQRMLSRRLNPNVFVFFLGGADQYSNGSFGYPFTGSAVMNGLFDGAESIYSFNGGLHQETQQVINAQYAWNSSAPGRLTPTSFDEGVKHWRALMKNDDLPAAIFASGAVFETACARVYGNRAGKAMARFQSFYEDRKSGDLPDFYPTRLYTLSVLWRLLQGDSVYWDREPSAIERRALESMHVSGTELHHRLARFWLQSEVVNQRGMKLLQEVSAAGDLRPDAVEDVEQLRLSLAAGSRIASLVAAYHDWLAGASADRNDVLRQCAAVSRWLHENVHTDFADPKGGDRSSWLEAAETIRSNLLAEK